MFSAINCTVYVTCFYEMKVTFKVLFQAHIKQLQKIHEAQCVPFRVPEQSHLKNFISVQKRNLQKSAISPLNWNLMFYSFTANDLQKGVVFRIGFLKRIYQEPLTLFKFLVYNYVCFITA